MKLENRLRRLEGLAKDLLLCPWCRCSSRDRVKPSAHNYIISSTCPYCGSDRVEYVSVHDSFDLEAAKIAISRKPGALYKDERAFAAATWMIHRQRVRRWVNGYYDESRVEARKKTDAQLVQTQPLSGKLAARHKARLDEKNQAVSFLKQMAANEKARYGLRRLPLDDEIDGIFHDPNAAFMQGSSPRMSEPERIARQTLYRALVMQACERVLWNQTLDETAAVITRLNHEIRESENARNPAYLTARELRQWGLG